MNARSSFPLHPEPRRRAVYPGKVAIRRAIEAAKANGLDVGGIELSPDGTIRILGKSNMPQQSSSLFDQLEAEGKL